MMFYVNIASFNFRIAGFIDSHGLMENLRQILKTRSTFSKPLKVHSRVSSAFQALSGSELNLAIAEAFHDFQRPACQNLEIGLYTWVFEDRAHGPTHFSRIVSSWSFRSRIAYVGL